MPGHFERLTESVWLPPWLLYEHEARYAFCQARVANKVVLDCGSGEGNGSRAIAEGLPRLLVAVDRSLSSVPLTRGKRIAPLAADAERLPMRDQSADVVVALEVIEHMDDPEGFLLESVRVLCDVGILICSTPNRTVRNPCLPLSGRPLNPWHLREWTPEEFRALLFLFFGKVELFGQRPQTHRVTRFFEQLTKIFSRRGAAIVRQLAKIALLILPGRRYDVRALTPDADYEFIVCVCSMPRGGSVRTGG